MGVRKENEECRYKEREREKDDQDRTLKERERGERGIDKDIEEITVNPIYGDCPEDIQSFLNISGLAA